MDCPSVQIIHVSENIYVLEIDGESHTRVEIIKPDPKIENKRSQSVEAMRELLYLVAESLGHYGSKHDSHRLYIISRPGENHPDFTEKDAEVIWGNPKDPSFEVFDAVEEEEDEEV